eukprot:gb/GECG01015060.1/.p1 GENE.gb/GECG01015060.1/~~gb/GECG01015060.1/.p1  ORF type:complete len:210 (+),score=25.86 gb/GECG01015060.1/:1-630(+)
MARQSRQISPNILWSVYEEAYRLGDGPVCVWVLAKIAQQATMEQGLESEITQKLWDKAIQHANKIACSQLVLEYFRKIKESYLEQKKNRDLETQEADTCTEGEPASRNQRPELATKHAGSDLSESTVQELWKEGNAVPLKHQYSLTYATALRPSKAIKRPKDWPLWRVVDSDVKLNPTLDTGKGNGKSKNNKKKRRAKTKEQCATAVES